AVSEAIGPIWPFPHPGQGGGRYLMVRVSLRVNVGITGLFVVSYKGIASFLCELEFRENYPPSHRIGLEWRTEQCPCRIAEASARIVMVAHDHEAGQPARD